MIFQVFSFSLLLATTSALLAPVLQSKRLEYVSGGTLNLTEPSLSFAEGETLTLALQLSLLIDKETPEGPIEIGIGPETGNDFPPSSDLVPYNNRTSHDSEFDLVELTASFIIENSVVGGRRLFICGGLCVGALIVGGVGLFAAGVVIGKVSGADNVVIADEINIQVEDLDINQQDGGAATGEPHLTRWGGKKYDFHGECDLVFLHAPDFGGKGEALRVHLRTTIRNHFSFVSEAALQYKNVLVNIEGEKLFFDNTLQTKFPVSQGPVEIKTHTVEHGTVGANRKNVTVHEIYVDGKRTMDCFGYGGFMYVFVVGGRKELKTSQGLMGEFGTGRAIGRDKTAAPFQDMDAFGMEWQVRGDEPLLFRNVRAPQLPNAKCNMPTETAKAAARKLLRSPAVKKAETACSEVPAEDYEDCVADVVATGDADLAGAYTIARF